MSNAIDLGGAWEIRADPDDRGVRERWFETRPTDGVPPSTRSRTPSLSESSSEGSGAAAAWRPITVPSAWQHTLGADYHGVAWYRHRVKLPDTWRAEGARVWLRFESVATDCRVWVNGREVGRHVGDYLSFQFELTAAIAVTAASFATAKVEIVARVDEMHAPRPRLGVTTENGHITKGFHDVLSLQHGGIWGGASLRRTGAVAISSNGLRVVTNLDSRTARFEVELEPGMRPADVAVSVETQWIGCGEDEEYEERFPNFDSQSQSVLVWIGPDERPTASVTFPSILPWSPEWPQRVSARVRVGRHDGVRWYPSDDAEVRFGFRTVTTGGPNNRSILLNGNPIQVRGVLHWGHEPRHIAPAPPPEQVRAEFTRLKEMGFNCVCLCMWYAPEHYYDIADEMGMLIWQEHPVWKSRMEAELLPEYRRLFDGFFRRDRRHPSVVIVSGSCEHERIHPELAAWWWKRAKEELPDRLVQVQTAFTSWVNPAQTDLHDEHVYESSGRWVKFLEDLQLALAELPPKPFVMGETIIGTAWAGEESEQRTANSEQEKAQSAKRKPQSPRSEGSGQLPVASCQLPVPPPAWWTPKGLDECRAFERGVIERYGGAALERFKRHAHGNNLLHRKFQSEIFRSYSNHAGWVMNQIRDVPVGRLGFMDERDRWRFEPGETLPWLCDRPILLKTPDWRTGFTGGRSIECAVGVANFAAGAFAGAIELHVGGPTPARGTGVRPAPIASTSPSSSFLSPGIECAPGDVRFVSVRFDLPRVDRPTRLSVRASTPGLVANTWDLWVLPEPGDAPEGVVRLDGIPFDARDHELDFEERAYSSGWGLKVRTWRPVLPHPEGVLFRCPLWRFDAPMPPGTRVVVTHKMTRGLVEFLERGGRIVWLAAGKSKGSLPTKFVTLWGQCPLVVEEGPLVAGDADWVVDLLHHDLTRRYTRAIAVEEITANNEQRTANMNIAHQVDPIVRYVFTHDRGAPKLMDAAFMTRVGEGLLIATSLDHTEDAGRHLMNRCLRFLTRDDAPCRGGIDPAIVSRIAGV
ncbi:MAG: glycoside hydrolase family 2 protein [Phycisphaerales bacterium]